MSKTKDFIVLKEIVLGNKLPEFDEYTVIKPSNKYFELWDKIEQLASVDLFEYHFQYNDKLVVNKQDKYTRLLKTAFFKSIPLDTKDIDDLQFFKKPLGTGYYCYLEQYNLLKIQNPVKLTLAFTAYLSHTHPKSFPVLNEKYDPKLVELINSEQLRFGIEPLTDENKQDIFNICRSGNIPAIETCIKLHFPDIDTKALEWPQIIYLLKEIEGKRNAQLQTPQQPDKAAQEPQGEKPKKGSKIIEAIRVFKENPTFTIPQVAEKAGCTKQYLHQSKDFKMIYKSQKQQVEIPKGYKDPETGEIESWQE